MYWSNSKKYWVVEYFDKNTLSIKSKFFYEKWSFLRCLLPNKDEMKSAADDFFDSINDNSIIDVTADQYYIVNKQPPYDKGKAKSWYGWKGRPHIRTFKLIMKLQPESKLSRLTNN